MGRFAWWRGFNVVERFGVVMGWSVEIESCADGARRSGGGGGGKREGVGSLGLSCGCHDEKCADVSV